ncbi:MAG: response regulator transcription factor [Magnetococcales bacterium]|nr:response regulator transcription factor [Magnetococcales bacterium]
MDILVIDDDRYIGLLLTEILRDEGHEIRAALNGPEGVAHFKEKTPDLVFLDIHLPFVSGCEVATQLKRLCADQLVPILFLTATTDDQELARCLDAGGDDFFIKPFNRTLLEAKIRVWERIIQQFRGKAPSFAANLSSLGKAILSQDEIEALTEENPVESEDELTGHGI